MKGQYYGVPQKRERVFIVSVRNDVLDKIGMPFMVLESTVFPDPEDHVATISDAISDIQLNNENRVEAEELKD